MEDFVSDFSKKWELLLIWLHHETVCGPVCTGPDSCSECIFPNFSTILRTTNDRSCGWLDFWNLPWALNRFVLKQKCRTWMILEDPTITIDPLSYNWISSLLSWNGPGTSKPALQPTLLQNSETENLCALFWLMRKFDQWFHISTYQTGYKEHKIFPDWNAGN